MKLPLPPDFVARMFAMIHEDMENLNTSLENESPISLRYQAKKISQEALDAHFSGIESPVLWHSEGRYLKVRPSFTADPWFHGGAYYVQEASSMVLHAFLEPENYQSILDLCAAPGGKSTLLAAAMDEDSVLVSNEVIKARASILAENMARWGNPNVVVTCNDPKDFALSSANFDLIVVDAPCSGEGMFRKDPNSRGEWSLENVQTCSLRQRRILSDILPNLAPEGHLIYSTCTFSPQENEEVIAWILKNFPEMELYPAALPEDWGMESVEIAGEKLAAWRCLPHKVKGEGFFICRLRKKEGISSKSNRKRKQERPDKKILEAQKALKSYIPEIVAEELWMHENKVFWLPKPVKDILPELESLYFLKKGLLLGELHPKGFAPHHELALYEDLAEFVPRIELDLRTAQDYLQKKELDHTGTEKDGWYLLCYESVAIGWGKVVGHKIKNHLPAAWRIRNASVLEE